MDDGTAGPHVNLELRMGIFRSVWATVVMSAGPDVLSAGRTVDELPDR